jgi:hypothetical protein
MPIHDWTRVDAGLFHAFHQDWIGVLARALNSGVLPRDYFALREPSTRGPILAEDSEYVRKADRIAVRRLHDDLVAVIEIVSPGNKASKNELRMFVEKTARFLARGIHVLVIDLFPPSKRDPQGIHKAIWDECGEEDFELPAGQPLTLAAYAVEPLTTAYVESVAVGDTLPDMPIFLEPEFYVMAPLEATYRTTWDDFFPAPVKTLLETPTAIGRGDTARPSQ